MGAHNHYSDGYVEHSRLDTQIADPGSAGTFDLKGKTDCYAIIASGTRVLPNSIPLGVNFRVYATGSVTITSVAAVTIATLTTGQFADFTPLTSTTWAAQRGVTGVGGTGSAALVTIADAFGVFNPDNLESVIQQIYNTSLPTVNAKWTTSATTTTATPAAADLSGAKIVHWVNTADGALSVTMPTAAQLYTAGGGLSSGVNFSYILAVTNVGNNTATLAAATGITYTGSPAIATLKQVNYVVTFQSTSTCTIVRTCALTASA